ncbi:MAG: response regulator transcription factor [Polyangiaceae bacterium]|nr:response regulator transcription factor [Polyangiaceae bacterium]
MKRVLLVDDDPDILESLELLLEERYEIIAAADGATAIAAATSRSLDAIVLDLMMPVLDGAAVMRELRARSVRVPVLIASAARDVAAQARALGAEDYIEKPFDPDLLEAKLARLVADGPAGGSAAPASGGGSSSGPGAPRFRSADAPEICA